MYTNQILWYLAACPALYFWYSVQFKDEPCAFTQLRFLKDLCGDLFILIVAETLWVHKIRLIEQLADSR